MEIWKKKLGERAHYCFRLIGLLAGYCILLYCILSIVVMLPYPLAALGEYCDPVVGLLQVVVMALVLILSGAGSRFLKGWRIALMGKGESCSLTELRRCLEAMRLARLTAFLVGGVVTLACAVDALYYMSPVGAWLGPMLAVSFLSFLYATIFALIQLPMEARLRQRVVNYMEEGVDEEPVEDAQTIYFRLRGMGLTDREAEVARLVARELSNKEIGKELFISDATVKKHITHILEKTGCDRRESLAELVKCRNTLREMIMVQDD